jgi:hypothetical protein
MRQSLRLNRRVTLLIGNTICIDRCSGRLYNIAPISVFTHSLLRMRILRERRIEVGGSMSVTEFRLRLTWPYYRDSLEKLKPSRGLFRNFQLCPHCEKNGRNPIVERINDCAPIISRSDGETFHLVLGDRPISYPAEKSSGKTDKVTVGFWYVKENDHKNRKNEEKGEDDMFAGTVVVMLRKPPGGIGLLVQLEIVADKLVEKLNKTQFIETFYEFDGDHLSKIA